jgi:hypothetical protein
MVTNNAGNTRAAPRAGRARAKMVPRSARARWDQTADAPAITHLRAQERIRVKNLLPLR